MNLHDTYRPLLDYFKSKLAVQSLKGVEKERQDMTVFSIMLLLSRLVPYSFKCTENKPVLESGFRQLIAEICDQIRGLSGNSTYFVRKISAQALLPLLPFDSWVPEIEACVTRLSGEKMRQNEAHGLVVRV